MYSETTESKERAWIHEVSRAWERRRYQIVELPVKEERTSEDYLSVLREQDPDYLVTINMVGFHWTTLLEGSVYNLLHAKQLHLLSEDRGQYEAFLQKEYAINLFFFTDNRETVKNWEKRYPRLPHLEWMSGPEALDDVVEKVLNYTWTADA